MIFATRGFLLCVVRCEFCFMLITNAILYKDEDSVESRNTERVSDPQKEIQQKILIHDST